jgi:hypothetical protein
MISLPVISAVLGVCHLQWCIKLHWMAWNIQFEQFGINLCLQDWDEDN